MQTEITGTRVACR